MPTLPSGLKLALAIEHIMEPDINWFRAPEGHFWYWTPADESPPPFGPNDRAECMPTTAPIPTSYEEISHYVRVCIGTEDGLMFWRGEMLADFPKYSTLSEADLEAWHRWINTDSVLTFLDSAMIRCQTQAEINKEARGYALLDVTGSDGNGNIEGEKRIDNPLQNSH